jgi:disease resistance protein RPM1
MAEAVVGLLIGKLSKALVSEAAALSASLLCKEASALRGLFREILEAKEDLESIQAYLQGAERFKDTDEITGIFVRKIRGLAFEIEDVVDEFTYKLEDKHGGFASKMKKRIKHAKAWWRLAHKLQDIKGRLRGAKQRKKDYAMAEMGNCPGDSASHPGDSASHFTRDEDLVGNEENKEKLMQWLTCDLKQRSKVVTVWGMPGVGKTTLVAHVYNTVKVDFDAAAWVTVSKSFHVEDLLKKIAGELGVTGDVSSMERRSLSLTIHNYLQGKKYMFVLDDVWTADVWSYIRNVFPTGCTGRIVFTSRNHEVSLLASTNCVVHLEPLEAYHSWVLFCKEAFWNDEDKVCPLDLQELAQKFVSKCKGLPIAIACIGRLLSCKPPIPADWENVYRELELQLSKDVILDVDMILKVSLEDLPYDLKNCFLHCALLPEDYAIKRRKAMRHWIAAGFIREKENKTLEEVAEGYLTELVNRSLL